MSLARFPVRLLLATLLSPGLASGADSEPDWSDSPEAYFLTGDERSEWKRLESRGAREDFKERYWLKRDPTPGTSPNEFRDGILARIRTADSRFGIQKIPGSRTARGRVFIVLGSPARVEDVHAPPPEPYEPGRPVGYLEGTETVSRWLYDKERTPRLLDLLDRASLEIRFILEPHRRTDDLENPGLFKELREVVARKTIVNPDMVAARVPAAAVPAPAALRRHELAEPVRRLLEAAAPASRSEGGAVFGSAVLWRGEGPAETVVWFFLPDPASSMELHARVTGEGGREIAAFSEPAELAREFSSGSAKGGVVLRRLALPPGSYDAAFALTGGGGARAPLASGMAQLAVPALGGEFAISSLILTRGPGTPDAKSRENPFAIGDVQLPPRADALFSERESLWYFVEVATEGDPDRITLEARLRKGTGQTARRGPFPARPRPLAPGRYLCGFELPLAGLDPGDYQLYVVVRDPVVPPSEPAVRRADFRLQS